MKLLLAAATAAALVFAAPAAAFTPADPYAAQQWYLAQDHAFDAWQAPPTNLQPVKVAIVDSGVDCALPDLQGRILAARSFVGGDPCTDTEGHGTVVAGEIAANLDTTGIVGIAYTAQLLVAKVVRGGTIPLRAEADAIRWAADQGARVINLSLGGVRDPRNASNDTFSQQEADAVAYAYSRGAVLVAAVGNSDEAPGSPATWPWASYPAALPHVIGVGALTKTGGVPPFSNRDPVYTDLAAPGVDIFSTFPLALTARSLGCTPQGYTVCGTDEYRQAEGTSFAAPQVAAAAAVLFAVDPALTNGQVETLLERSADDVDAANGCRECPLGRDLYSGWGRLDVAKAVEVVLSGGPLPPRDAYETNDNAGTQAYTLWGRKRAVGATLDYYDDPVDVYRVSLAKGERLRARLAGTWSGANVSLLVWRPGTTDVLRATSRGQRVAASAAPGGRQHLLYRSPKQGWYYVEVRVTSPGGGAYTLRLAKTPAPKKARHTTTAP